MGRSALDPKRHHVEYHRIEAGRYVARVLVRCSPIGHGETSVDVAYTFVGISDIGNADIASMSQAAFDDKMRRWRGWIVALRPEVREGH